MNELTKKRDSVAKNIAALEGEIKTLDDTRDTTTAQLYATLAKIEKEIEDIEKPLIKKRQKLIVAKRDKQAEIRLMGQKIEALEWKGKAPKNNTEIEAWFDVHKEILFNGIHLWGTNAITRTPKIKKNLNYKVIAIKDCDPATQKAYVVLSPSNDIYASLLVNPAQHIGDYTRVEIASIKGKDVRKKLELNTWAVKKPLEIFITAVEDSIKKVVS